VDAARCAALAAGWVVAFALFFALMAGGVLRPRAIGTDRWGGLPLTVILTLIGITASAPIGIALALARRSSLALLRSLAVAYIELVRGVPLITVLFVATFLFPLGPARRLAHRSVLARRASASVLFQAAYMAETVRGGLQSVSRAQHEAATSSGLRYWQAQRAVILPQALVAGHPGLRQQPAVDLHGHLAGHGRVDVRPDRLAAPRARRPALARLLHRGYLFIAAIYFAAASRCRATASGSSGG
jgi:general L-amino acid transport system permease protein